MSKTDAMTLRSEVLIALTANTTRLANGLQAELARSKEPGMGRPLQFEVDPLYWHITSCASEEPIMAGDWLDPARWAGTGSSVPKRPASNPKG